MLCVTAALTFAGDLQRQWLRSRRARAPDQNGRLAHRLGSGGHLQTHGPEKHRALRLFGSALSGELGPCLRGLTHAIVGYA